MKDVAGLIMFIIGFSLPLLTKWVDELINSVLLIGVGLVVSTLGIALLAIRTRKYEKLFRRNAFSLLFFILLDLFFLYLVVLTILFPAPKDMSAVRIIAEKLKYFEAKEPGWHSLWEIFEEISETDSFQKPQVWWIYKVLSHGNKSCETTLSSLNKLIETNSIKEAEVLLNNLHQSFKKMDLIASEFAVYYVFLATLALFFSTIIFLGGKAPEIGISHKGASSGLLTYSYPLLLSFGLACSSYTKDLYPLFSWVPYAAIMLVAFKKIGYDRGALFGLAILTGGLLGAYTPSNPFSCLWYFCIFCFFMLILLSSVMPGITRDILLAASILAGCAGVNSAISMIFIQTSTPPSLALFSVIYDLVSIIFALSEVSALPRVLEAGIRSVAREGFWPILGFTISVLFLAFGLFVYFNPVPCLLWILSLSLLCYVLIYSMRSYALRRRRLAKYGELGDVRALFLVCIPVFAFVSVFPALYRIEGSLYLLIMNIAFSASALSFIIWYIRGDLSLRAFLLESSPFKFTFFVMTMILGPALSLLNVGFGVYYLPVILPTIGLLSIHRKKRGKVS